MEPYKTCQSANTISFLILEVLILRWIFFPLPEDFIFTCIYVFIAKNIIKYKEVIIPDKNNKKKKNNKIINTADSAKKKNCNILHISNIH